MATIAVVDYGMGNLRSVAKALEHVDPRARVRVSQDARELRAADRIVFPGQGAIGGCMEELRQRDLLELVRELARSKPFLGICLGMQALLEHSDENAGVDGLGLAPGRVRHFRSGFATACGIVPRKIPLMGWVQVSLQRRHPLFDGIADGEWFYFVHSYFVEVLPEWTIGLAHYGIDFTAVLGKENVLATQFHPEKSQRCGLRLLSNFSRWSGTC